MHHRSNTPCSFNRLSPLTPLTQSCLYLRYACSILAIDVPGILKHTILLLLLLHTSTHAQCTPSHPYTHFLLRWLSLGPRTLFFVDYMIVYSIVRAHSSCILTPHNLFLPLSSHARTYSLSLSLYHSLSLSLFHTHTHTHYIYHTFYFIMSGT